jgi:hypothetical protein
MFSVKFYVMLSVYLTVIHTTISKTSGCCTRSWIRNAPQNAPGINRTDGTHQGLMGKGWVGVSVDWVTGDPPNPALEPFQVWFQSNATERGLKENPSSHRIQVDMASHSYIFPIPILFLSYESKEPWTSTLNKHRSQYLADINFYVQPDESPDAFAPTFIF